MLGTKMSHYSLWLSYLRYEVSTDAMTLCSMYILQKAEIHIIIPLSLVSL
jgi:hypothetical protein